MASYRQAIAWIAENDDTSGIQEAITVSAALVADLFDKPDEKVVQDVVRYAEKRGIRHA